MKSLLVLFCLFTGGYLFAQDTTVTWLFNIQDSAYTVHYDKKNIPAELYTIIGISSLDEIANPGKPYQKGCTGLRPRPMKRLNWIASDNNDHWVLSVSYGGRASGTKFYFIDKDTGKLNSNVLYLMCAEPENLTLTTLLPQLAARKFLRGY